MGTLENIAGRKARTVTTNITTTQEKSPMLTSRIHVERVAAHEACKAQVALEVDAFNREIARLTLERNAKAEHGMHAANAALKATRSRVAESIACDWHKEMDPLFAEWIEEPGRRLAAKIADVARAMRARSHEELGCALWDGVFTISLSQAMARTRPIVIALDHVSCGPFVEWSARCWASLESPQAFFDALERLELAIADRARRTDAPTDEEHARFDVLRRVSDPTGREALLAELDAKFKRQRHEAALAEDARPGANRGTVRFFGGA